MTHLEFFEAFEKGQRKFKNLDFFEDLEGFSNKNFSGVEMTINFEEIICRKIIWQRRKNI